MSKQRVTLVRQLYVDRHRERKGRFIQNSLDTYEGREFFWDLMSLCGTFEVPRGLGDDIHRALGKQEIGRQIEDTLFTYHADAYILMRAEAQERLEKQQRDLEGARAEEDA